jgi:hypothetical protein
LTNPPHGIGNEFEATGFIKTLRGFNEAKVTFVNEIAQGQSLVLVLFGN